MMNSDSSSPGQMILDRDREIAALRDEVRRLNVVANSLQDRLDGIPEGQGIDLTLDYWVRENLKAHEKKRQLAL